MKNEKDGKRRIVSENKKKNGLLPLQFCHNSKIQIGGGIDSEKPISRCGKEATITMSK